MEADQLELVYRKVGTMLRHLEELERDSPASLDEYREKGNVIQRFTEREWQLIVEAGTDANGNLLGRLGEPAPRSARESYDQVYRLGAITEETRRRFCHTFVGFRNRLVHDYEELDNEAVYRTAQLLLTHARRYAAELTAYLDRLCCEEDGPEGGSA